VVHPVATLKVVVAVAAVATPTLTDLNDSHQPGFEKSALNYKAASSIVAATNKLILSSQL
jgi:hypothetical protein